MGEVFNPRGYVGAEFNKGGFCGCLLQLHFHSAPVHYVVGS